MIDNNCADITVITPVYLISEYLERFFKSFEDQVYKTYKLFIVVDGSPDNSLEICKTQALKDDRIEVFDLDHVGVIAAREYALQRVKTKYVVYADGDDYVEPSYLLNLKQAIEKYDADLAISRVKYRSESTDEVFDQFMERGECYFSKNDFSLELPRLLDERRLNYLYGKIYKTQLLKKCVVAQDVKQGSDTMIVCQYVGLANGLVVIDDLDYNYVKYSKRSITSYSGEEAFLRLKRINIVISGILNNYGYLNEQMKCVIDKRILLSAIWVIDKIMASTLSDDKKAKQIDLILSDETYLQSYKHYKDKCFEVWFDAIKPQSGAHYVATFNKARRVEAFKAKVLSLCPKFVLKIYRKIKNG